MISQLIQVLFLLLVVGIIVALVYVVTDAIPIPAPFNRIVKIVALVIGALIIILALLPLAGVPVSMPAR